MRRRLVAIGLIALVLGVALTAYWRASGRGGVTISVAEAQRGELSVFISASAKVAPPIRNLNFTFGGRLAKLNVAENEVITEGQVLAQLDVEGLTPQVDQAEANLANATRAVHIAQHSVKDADTALDIARLSLSKIQGGTRTEDLAVSQATVDQAGEEVTSAEQSLADVTTAAERAEDEAEQAVDAARTAVDDAEDYLDEVEDLEGQPGFNEATTAAAEGAVNTAEATLEAAELSLETVRSTNEQSINSAEAVLASAQKALLLTQAQHDLNKAPAQSQDVDLAKADVRRAKNAVGEAKDLRGQAREQQRQAQATLDEAEAKLGEATLKAPVSGTIATITVEEGEIVSGAGGGPEGQPFMSLIKVDRVEVRAEVDEADIAQVKNGQKAEVTLDAFPDRSFMGRVVEMTLVSSTSTTGGTIFPVKVELDKGYDDVSLRTGMTGSADIIKVTKKDVLIIPFEAVIQERGQDIVFVVKEDEAERRKVTFSLATDTSYEITEGLRSGEKVVTAGIDKVKDGDKVRIETE